MKRGKIDNVVTDFSRFYILTILYEGPTHGYDIMTKFQERVGKKISPGLIYPFLSRLEERGLVSIESEMVGEKERKVYYLTEEGIQFTEKNFQRFAGIISTALEPSLEICAHCGCKVYEGAHTETIDGKDMTFCCIHCASHFKHEHEEIHHTVET
jgi:DNA-binding PadR family transcriptional regulator